MNLVLDTSAYIRYGAADQRAISAMQSAESLFMPFASWAELLSGFRKGTRFQSNIDKLNQIVERLEIEWIAADRGVAELYSQVYDDLRRKGRPLPTNDLWISACCLSVGGTLLTSDSHFQQVNGLPLELLPTGAM